MNHTNVPIEPITPTELFRDVKGYEVLYSVSNFGRVYSHKVNRLLRLTKAGQASLSKMDNGEHKCRSINVALLMAQAFIPNPHPKIYKVAFLKDGNKENRTVENVRWGTMGQHRLNTLSNHPELRSNIANKREGQEGLSIKRYKPRINAETAANIFRLREEGHSVRAIAREVLLNDTYINNILAGYYVDADND